MRREKDSRSLPRSTLRWSSWASAGSWSASAGWVRVSLLTVAALPLRLLAILLSFALYAPLENKHSEYLNPLHLSPLFSSSRHKDIQSVKKGNHKLYSSESKYTQYIFLLN